MGLVFAGLDIETSGLYYDKGHRMLQISIFAKKPAFSIVRDVCPNGFSNLVIEDKALETNHFTLDRIKDAAFTSAVDIEVSEALAAAGFTHDSIVPVGWNVIAFDMSFLTKEMPLTAKYFQYSNDSHSIRAVDLTAFGLLLARKTGEDYSAIKKEIHQIIVDIMGYDDQHDALFDAEEALLTLDLFDEMWGR